MNTRGSPITAFPDTEGMSPDFRPVLHTLTVHQVFIPDRFTSRFVFRPKFRHRLRLAVSYALDLLCDPHSHTANFRSTHLLSPANYILHCRECIGKFVNQWVTFLNASYVLKLTMILVMITLKTRTPPMGSIIPVKLGRFGLSLCSVKNGSLNPRRVLEAVQRTVHPVRLS